MLHSQKISAICFLLFALCLAGLVGWQFPKLNINNDILALFPNQAEISQAVIARQEAIQTYNAFISNKVLFLVGHTDEKRAQNAAMHFSNALSEQAFNSVSAVTEPSVALELNQLYLRHAPLILSREDKHNLASRPDWFIQKKIRALYTNPSLLNSTDFSLDPLSLSGRFLYQNLSRYSGQMINKNGFLQVTSNGVTWVLVQAALKDSAFSISQQAIFKQAVDAAKQNTQDLFADVDILSDGAIYFALSGTSQAKSEISTVGLGSAIGIVALILLVFFSLRVLVFALLPTAVGIISGFAVCHAVFGQVHTIALVFGASLIGVSIDYAFHFLCERQHQELAWRPNAGLKRLRWGLGLGAFTSASAYITFVFSGFPGFQQIATFSAAGLIAACITVATLFPLIFARPAQKNMLASRMVLVLNHYQNMWPNREWVLIPIVGISVAVFIIGLQHIQLGDDIRAMQSPAPELVKRHQAFREISGSGPTRQFALYSAHSPQELLEGLEQIHQSFDRKGITAYSISDWIPSKKAQLKNQQLLQAQLVETGLLQQFFEQIPLSEAVLTKLKSNFKAEPSDKLGFEAAFPLVQSALPQPLSFQLDGLFYAYITFPAEAELEKIQQTLAQHSGAIWVDQVKQTNELLKTYREKSMYVLLIAFAVVYLICLLRYGALSGLYVVAPPAVACILSVSALALLNIPISLFSIMALVLVLGIGIDYCIFIREINSRPSVTLFAIALSTITTVLSFGLLSVSQTDAISGFGTAVFIGIALCFFLSPIAKIGAR